MKNYKTETGISNFVHQTCSGNILAEGVTFKIKGPMGKGLDIPTSGKCVALSGGTGILVFIDLIAHLILRIIGEKGGLNIFE